MAKRIITISREYGSGGRLVGRMLADRLGIAFYDRELIAIVAKESGFTLDFIEETGEYSSTSSLLFNMAMIGMYRQNIYTEENMPIADRIHILQSRIIKEIADKEPCVIVGRSADYILKDRKDCVNAFLYADSESKARRATTYFEIPAEHVEKELRKKDKARASHYRHYTGQTFGMAANYHLSLDTGLIGIERCVDIIEGIYKADS